MTDSIPALEQRIERLEAAIDKIGRENAELERRAQRYTDGEISHHVRIEH